MKRHKRLTGAALVLLLAVCAVVVAGAFAPGGTPQARAEDPDVLTVTGYESQVERLTLAELQALPVYTGHTGMKNSAGTITAPHPVKGVLLTDVLALVGGMTDKNTVDVGASDGYSMPLSYEQAATGAGFAMYDSTTGVQEAPAATVSVVLIYEENGAPLAADAGPVRLAICQTEDVGQVADGHWQVKQVDKLTVRAASAPWKVRMYGLKRANGTRQTATLDRGSFFSCAAPGCHGSTWVSPSEKSWSGVPLFLIVGKVDGGKQHDYGAYNEVLALKGYRIKLVNASGKYVIVKSRTIRNRSKIILANKLQGVELTAKYYPLRLVGPSRYIDTSKYLGRITKLVLLPK
jgi:DMSO/TMAO reductase YedYZ molybdopterin-dependent catalytic subunit